MSIYLDSWACPNDPPCPHGTVVHDIYDYDDPLPSCCVEGCRCGHDPALRERLRREIEAEALRREQEQP